SSRPDVGKYIGDNGLHGFTIVTPASLKDGKAHSISATYESTSTSLSLNGKPLTCTNSRAYFRADKKVFFIRQQYYGCLNREAGAGGLSKVIARGLPSWMALTQVGGGKLL